MGLKKWDELPAGMRNQNVRGYYDILHKRRFELILKRLFDIIAAIIAFVILLPLIIAISAAVKMDSKGTVIFRQERVTQYGKRFRIYKFRTMVSNAESFGSQVTAENDMRITRTGRFLRKYRLDEVPQLINIIKGDMSFVGTRPEVVKYVEQYSDEMMATLLLRAGVTSEASIKYKDEEKLLSDIENIETTYIEKILPQKMKYNLEAIKHFSLINEAKTIAYTAVAVTGKSGVITPAYAPAIPLNDSASIKDIRMEEVQAEKFHAEELTKV